MCVIYDAGLSNGHAFSHNTKSPLSQDYRGLLELLDAEDHHNTSLVHTTVQAQNMYNLLNTTDAMFYPV